MDSSNHAVTAFCRTCETAFGVAFHSRAPGSRLDRALDALGAEGLAVAVCEAMRPHVMRVLWDEAAQNLVALSVCGPLAERAMVLDVVASAIRDVTLSAGVPAEAA